MSVVKGFAALLNHLDPPIIHLQAMGNLVGPALHNRSGVGVSHPLTIFGVDRIQEIGQRGHELLRILFKNTKHLIGPVQRIVFQIQLPTAQTGDALRLIHAGFTDP